MVWRVPEGQTLLCPRTGWWLVLSLTHLKRKPEEMTNWPLTIKHLQLKWITPQSSTQEFIKCGHLTWRFGIKFNGVFLSTVCNIYNMWPSSRYETCLYWCVKWQPRLIQSNGVVTKPNPGSKWVSVLKVIKYYQFKQVCRLWNLNLNVSVVNIVQTHHHTVWTVLMSGIIC